MCMTYNILTLDGGGVKGIFSLQLLIRLITEYPNLLEDTDLIAGASTGAIIALALANGSTPSNVLEFYEKNLPKVFKDSYWDNVVDLGTLLGADFDYTNLKSVLKSHFGTSTLADLQKKILVPAIDLDNESTELRTWKPKFYNSFQEDDLSETIVDVAVRSAVAPTYFPIYQGFTDGGLAANCPAMSAIAQALDTKTASQELSNIRVISIGVGYSPTFISGKKLDWGTSQWAKLLMPVVLDSMMFTTDYQCKKLLGDNYLRIDSAYGKKVGLVDLSQVEYLKDTANKVELSAANTWVINNWKK
jgi:uncharacterized protein